MDIELSVYLKNLGYDEDEIEYMVEDVLPVVKKNIGWEDNRTDKRFIVKFHNIVYNLDDDTMNELFDDFCNETYEWVKEKMAMQNCDERNILTTYDIGHYQGLILTQKGINEITENNIYDVVTEAFDEFEYHADNFLQQHIDTVNILQELEDTYVDWWGEYLRDYKECINGA